MHSNVGLSKEFWDFLFGKLIFTAINLKTPIEIWSSAPVDYSI